MKNNIIAFPGRDQREGTRGIIHVWMHGPDAFEIGHESASGSSWGFFDHFSTAVITALRSLFNGWYDAVGSAEYSTGKIKDLAATKSPFGNLVHESLYQALDDVAGDGRGEIGTKRLGHYLGKHCNRIVAGLKLQVRNDSHSKQKVWSVSRVEANSAAADDQSAGIAGIAGMCGYNLSYVRKNGSASLEVAAETIPAKPRNTRTAAQDDDGDGIGWEDGRGTIF